MGKQTCSHDDDDLGSLAPLPKYDRVRLILLLFIDSYRVTIVLNDK